MQSQLQLSVLTIHQSVPIEDKATITLSLNARNSNLSIDEVIESLREINHVTKVDLISMTMGVLTCMHILKEHYLSCSLHM